MKNIILPAREIAEQTLTIESLMIIPSQSRLIVQTGDMAHQFERELTEAELETVLALVEPAVQAKVALATVVDVVKEEPVVDPIVEVPVEVIK